MFQGARGKAARRPSEEAAGASALYSEEEYGEFRAQARFQSDDEARLKSQPNHGPYGGARGSLTGTAAPRRQYPGPSGPGHRAQSLRGNLG